MGATEQLAWMRQRKQLIAFLKDISKMELYYVSLEQLVQAYFDGERNKALNEHEDSFLLNDDLTLFNGA